MKKSIKSNRRSFVKTSVLGTLGAMSVPALLGNYSNSVSKEEKLTVGAKPGATKLSENLENNTRFTVCATFETEGEIRIPTGIGAETVSVRVASDGKDAKEPTVSWRYAPPDTSNPNNPDFRGRITVGGRAKPAFGWTDKVLEWTDYYDRIRNENPLAKRKFFIALEHCEGFGRLYINGMLMHEWTVQITNHFISN